MKIKIISDSTCDLSPELIDQYDITLTSLYILKDGIAYKDRIEIMPSDIFFHVDNGGDLCTTSAVSQFDYTQVYTRYAQEYDAVIQITIGSEFSSCYQNACAASEDFANVYVVDSCNLSSGQGHIVIAAAKMAQQQIHPLDIVKSLQNLVPRVESSFLIERLDYMRKGGRCSAIAVLGSNLLGIKPCIEVKNGKMSVSKKYRGSFERCICQYVKDRLQNRNDLSTDLIFVTHPAASFASVATAKNEIQKYINFSEIIETKASCTISCHCGPHTLGILFVRK